MKKIEWKKTREIVSKDGMIKTIFYTPAKCASGIRIETEKKAIRITSGSRYETTGIYINRDGARTKHKYATFAEAKAAAERMLN